MKIIKPGKTPVEWWFRVVNHCQRCGAQWKLEPGDELRHHDDQRDGEAVESKCPTCGRAQWTGRAAMFQEDH